MKFQLPFLLIAIAAWGWFNQNWLASAVLASLLLLNKFVDWRWEFTRKQLYRISDFSVVLIIVSVAFGYLGSNDTNPIYITLQWSPVLIAPILMAQLYNVNPGIPMSAVFYSMRADDKNSFREIDFSLIYVAVTVMAAGTSQSQNSEYFLFLVACIVGLIWAQQPARGNRLAWLLIVTLAVVSAYFGNEGLRQLHAYVQEKSLSFMSDWSTNPFKSHTSIGQIGELKLSDQIEFHVKADAPMLLHQASYNFYYDNVWHASDVVFKPYNNQIAETTSDLKQIEIVQDFGADLILALPDGTSEIKGLEAADIRSTSLGSFKVTDPPPWGRYQVTYSGVRLSKPGRSDLRVPDQHKYWLKTVSEKLKLSDKSPDQIAAAIEHYFHTEYAYTLYTPGQSDADQALIHFMLERQAGHCEYFAMASVFLLRYAGIPARLANGYSVQEYDPALGMFVVRRRHSHAWAIASIGDSWQAVDSTPSQWLEMEAENASSFQAVTDWFYNTLFTVQKWRANSDYSGLKLFSGLVLLLITLYLLWFLRKEKLKPKSAFESEDINERKNFKAGLDSDLNRIDQYLAERSEVNGQMKYENESALDWARRLGDVELESIVRLHYRYRFDPDGLSDDQRGELEVSVNRWIESRAG